LAGLAVKLADSQDFVVQGNVSGHIRVGPDGISSTASAAEPQEGVRLA
jgi:hypothetical protein